MHTIPTVSLQEILAHNPCCPTKLNAAFTAAGYTPEQQVPFTEVMQAASLRECFWLMRVTWDRDKHLWTQVVWAAVARARKYATDADADADAAAAAYYTDAAAYYAAAAAADAAYYAADAAAAAAAAAADAADAAADAAELDQQRADIVQVLQTGTLSTQE